MHKQFSTPVLLDVVFCQTTQKWYPRDSKYFQRTWASLLEMVDGADVGQQRYAKNRKFTLRVPGALGGKEVSAYVKKFLDQHPCWAYDFDSDSSETEDFGATDGSIDG